MTAVTRTTHSDDPIISVEDAAERTGAVNALVAARRVRAATLDAVGPTDALVMERSSNADAPDKVVLRMRANGTSGLVATINDEAHHQLALKVGIDWSYYQRMLATQPDLLAHNVNTWFVSEPDKHQLRMLRPMDDEMTTRLVHAGAQAEVRAVLSPRYKTLDNDRLLEMVLPFAAESGVNVTEWKIDPKHFHIRFVGPERSVEDVRAQYAMQQHRGSKWVKEMLQFGASLRNSETGHGSMLCEPFAKILECLNGLIVASKLREVHVGARKEDGFRSSETHLIEEAAAFSRLVDRFREAIAPEQIVKTAYAIEEGQRVPLLLPEKVTMFEFLDGVGEWVGLLESEKELFQEAVTQNMMKRGQQQMTRFAVSQGLTAIAKESTTFQRRSELEREGFEMLTSDVEKIINAAKAHAN